MSHSPARNDPYQIVTDTILAHLQRGVVPWRCPWNRSTGRPRNFQSGREYQGINLLLLGLQSFASPWWMTFRQVQERGGKVRQGERGTPVMKWGRYEKSLKNGDGTEEKKSTFYLKSYRVFNAVQIEGIQFPEPEQQPPLDSAQRLDRAEQIIAQMPEKKPVIKEGRTTQASYRPHTDTIQMPAFARFQSPEDYHLTLFHELIHATGHTSRLNRKGVMESDGFKGKVYSHEELIAEMGAAFLGMEADIVRDQHEQSAAYLQSWLDALGEPEHRRWIVLAANQAGRAAGFILGRPETDTATSPEPTAEQSALPSAA